MTTTAIRLTLAAIGAAGVVLLTGCDPATPGTGGSGLGCDPHGMAGINGCTPASATPGPGAGCDPGWLQRAVATDRREAQPGETWAVTDGCGHTIASDPQTKADTDVWNKQFDQALRQGPPPVDGTVVATHQDGFAECVVDVDETNGDHSRFTESSCPAVGSHYHQKGGW